MFNDGRVRSVTGAMQWKGSRKALPARTEDAGEAMPRQSTVKIRTRHVSPSPIYYKTGMFWAFVISAGVFVWGLEKWLTTF